MATFDAANTATPHIAIVGGGITGTVAAAQLSRLLPNAHITLFDQGRGLGGRASHRRVVKATGKVVAPDHSGESYFAWDHGAQFFRGDDAEFRETILQDWLDRGVAAAWAPKTAALGPDFFGVGGADARPVYCGVGGFHALTSGAMDQLVAERGDKLVVRSGIRVGGVERSGPRWTLRGVGGAAAIHDAKLDSRAVEAVRAAESLGAFDAVVVTDASAAMDGWHRASAGLPAEFVETAAKRVADRVRVCLFTALVAFETKTNLDVDACTFDGTGGLWFAAKTSSKPGLETLEHETWTLVSTPRWAADEVARVPMRDATTGLFIPQDPSYLREPAAALLEAFETAAANSLGSAALPKAAYLTAQRWGSAFPAPAAAAGRDDAGAGEHARDVAGTAYDAAPLEDFAGNFGARATYGADDFCDGGASGLYYAGDFCSPRPPGVEAAALSARHAAVAIARRFGA